MDRQEVIEFCEKMRIPTGDEEAIDRLVYLAATAAKRERERCIIQTEREKQTWHFTNSSRAVRTACDNIISMIRGDK